MERLDTSRVEIVDDDGRVEWTGTAEEFFAANDQFSLSEEEREHLARRGYVWLGGGAFAETCVRYVSAEHEKAS